MSVDSRHFPCSWWLLLMPAAIPAIEPPASTYSFSTAQHSIEMRVSFPTPYEGGRLRVYRAGKEDCLMVETGAPGCTEHFVGALAVVAFTVRSARDGKPVAASIREVVTVLSKSTGLPDRPPYVMTILLPKGVGNDLQVFGYDESPLPPSDRAAERERAWAAWRRYRQELYLNNDRQPFAVIEWLHTTTRIRIVSLEAGAVAKRR